MKTESWSIYNDTIFKKNYHHNKPIYVIGNTNICIRLYEERDKHGAIYKAINTDLRWGGVVLLQWEGKVESQVKKNGTKKKKKGTRG